MLRSSVVAVVAWLVCVGLGAAVATASAPTWADQRSAKPPASAEKQPPSKPGTGDIRVTYSRQKAIACEVVDQPKGANAVQCEGKLVDAFEPTSLKLLPVTKTGEPDAARSGVDIEFSAKDAEHLREVTLTAGPWSVKWGALTERFFVVAGDEFDVELEAREGVCRAVGARCQLDVGKRRKSVEFPEVRRSR